MKQLKQARASYGVKGYHTDRYDEEVFQTFKDVHAMWKWCREFLASGGCKVVAYSRETGRWRGSHTFRRNFHRATIRKIAELTAVEQVPR